MKGYKIGLINNIKVLIILSIPYDALTNVHRPNIIDKKNAKYRCSHAHVTHIIDSNFTTYQYAISGFYNKKILYEVGKLVISDFDKDITIENGRGIHFFLDNNMAINYRTPILQQYWLDKENVYRDYYGNGQLRKEINYILNNDERITYKIIQEYYPNGQIKLDYNLAINKYDGLYTEWYANGIMKKRLIYEKNKVISYIEHWDIRGNKHFIFYGSY